MYIPLNIISMNNYKLNVRRSVVIVSLSTGRVIRLRLNSNSAAHKRAAELKYIGDNIIERHLDGRLSKGFDTLAR